MAGLPEHQVVELIRHVAWTELSVEVEGDTVSELLHGIYAAGGSDVALGIASLSGSGVPINLVVLDADDER